MLLLLPQRVALIVTTNPPPPNKAWAIRVEWRRAISAQLAGKQGGTYIFLPRCFADCESCTRPISTNSGSMEAGECGLTRGTCFVARRHEVVAVALLLWISWCFGCGGIFSGVFSFFFQAEDGIRDVERSRGLGDVYKRQRYSQQPGDRDHLETARDETRPTR